MTPASPSRPDPERRGGRADRGAPPSRAAAHDRRGVRPGDAPRGGDGDELPLLADRDVARRSGLPAGSRGDPARCPGARARRRRRPPVPPGSTRHPHGARASRSPNRPGSVLVPDHRRRRAAQPQPGNPGGPGPPPPGSRRREDRARRDRRLDPGLARPERGAPLERSGERLLPRPRRPLPVQERGLRQRGRAPPGARRHASAPLRPPREPLAWRSTSPSSARAGST